MSQELENITEQVNWHWRNTMRPVRFFGFDARASIIAPILLFYPRVSTVIFSLMLLFLFRQLERRGLSFPAALRAFRAWVIGKYRPGWVSAQKSTFKDYG